jgi:hypothetical protein
MYSPFSSTSNGCDSCSTLEDAFGPSMGSSGSTANINQLLQQASQNAVMNQHANNVMPGSAVGQQTPVVYVQQQPATQGMNRPAVNNVATMAMNNANAKQAMNNMVAKAVNPAANTVAVPAVVAAAPQQIVMDEGFADMSSGVPYSILFMNLGFVVLAALACNEAFKYYINKAIQTAEGQTHYYLGYAIIALLLVVGAHYYSKRATAV